MNKSCEQKLRKFEQKVMSKVMNIIRNTSLGQNKSCEQKFLVKLVNESCEQNLCVQKL